MQENSENQGIGYKYEGVPTVSVKSESDIGKLECLIQEMEQNKNPLLDVPFIFPTLQEGNNPSGMTDTDRKISTDSE